MKRKVIAGILIAAGLSVMSVPFFWKFTGCRRNQQMVEEFWHIAEEKGNEEKGEGQEEPQASISEEDAAKPAQAEVIGLIEIEALDVKYAVLEGTGNRELSCGIGHIPDTAGIGGEGNCVLAGHRGSRYGNYFKYLNELETGDVVRLTDKKGVQYFYEAESMEVVGPYENSVKDQGEEKMLTLLTCENNGTMRLVVRCRMSEASLMQE